MLTENTVSLSYISRYHIHMFAAIMLLKWGGTIMILDILAYCKIMSPLIWPEKKIFFFFFGHTHGMWKFPDQGQTHATTVTQASAVIALALYPAASKENSIGLVFFSFLYLYSWQLSHVKPNIARKKSIKCGDRG